MAAVPIDYSSLYVGQQAPPGAKAKLRRAARLAASQASCKHVTGGGYLPLSERNRDHATAPYFITCSDPHKEIDPGARNYYFTDAELRADRIPRLEAPVPRAQAIELCLDAVRQRLQYPSSAKFNAWSTQASLGGTRNWRVVIPFTALNGFGNRVPGSGKCIIDPARRIDVEISRH